MNWTYSLERMPSPRGDNRHLVRVTSRARNAREDVRVRFFTNVDEHAVRVGLNLNFRSIKFNISAKLGDVSENGHGDLGSPYLSERKDECPSTPFFLYFYWPLSPLHTKN